MLRALDCVQTRLMDLRADSQTELREECDLTRSDSSSVGGTFFFFSVLTFGPADLLTVFKQSTL